MRGKKKECVNIKSNKKIPRVAKEIGSVCALVYMYRAHSPKCTLCLCDTHVIDSLPDLCIPSASLGLHEA